MTSGSAIPCTKEQFDDYYRDINAYRRTQQNHGRCVCPPSKRLSCDMDCYSCPYHTLGDMSSLDSGLKDDDDDEIELTAMTCREHYRNMVDSFILVSSDSDYWGLISSLPEARFLVMIEREKCGHDMKAALANSGIFYCYIDDFYSGNSEAIKENALFNELYRYLDQALSLNVEQMLDAAITATRITMTAQERRRFYDKNYRRKTTAARVVWICATFNTRGKKYCASKQIPEETLDALVAQVTRNPADIQKIIADDGNTLHFHLADGSVVTRTWQIAPGQSPGQMKSAK